MPGPRILLIEDDLDIARVVAFDLEEAGFQVIHAEADEHNVAEAAHEGDDERLLATQARAQHEGVLRADGDDEAEADEQSCERGVHDHLRTA